MSFFFNKTARTASAVVISSLALAGMVWADYQSGNDVGKYCAKQGLSDNAAFINCCNGGCGSMHPVTDDAGWNLCMDKCQSYFQPQVGAG